MWEVIVGVARRFVARIAIWSFGCVLAISVSSLAGAQEASPQDRVSWGPVITKPTDVWNVPDDSVAVGRVRQFDEQYLILVSEGGQSTRVDSNRVHQIEIDWQNESAANAMDLVRQRRYKEAVSAIDAARKLGIPLWRQRFLIAALVQSADALGSSRTAGTLFLNLADSSPPPMLYADMPLCWTAREPERLLAEQAAKWMNDSRETARLLGASWLLLGEQGPAAQDVIQELLSADNQVIAELAVVQSWRSVPPPRTMGELSKWLEFRDSLLRPLQIGPTEFLADRLMRIGEVDLAIGQLLRIATVHGDRYHRAAIALKTASKLLEREGRVEEAKRLKPWIDRLTRP